MKVIPSLDEEKYYSEEELLVENEAYLRILLTVSGNLEVCGSVRTKYLFVRGNAIIDGDLEASYVIVDGILNVKGDIKVRDLIITGEGIIAKTIRSRSIKTSGAIDADWVFSTDFDVVCDTLQTRTLPLSRKFWANQPTLAKWKKVILSNENCWTEWKEIAREARKSHDFNTIDFGHWLLNVQFKNFLRIPCELPEMEDVIVPKTINEEVEIKELELATLDAANASSQLYDIIKNPKKTPYPDYSKDPSYEQIVKNWGSDIRKSYNNTNVDLDSLRTCVLQSVVPDQTVKQQLLDEIGYVQNVRQLVNNHHKFISDTFFDKGARLTNVRNLSKVGDSSSVLFDILGMYVSVLGLVNGVAGGIGAVFLAVLNLMKDSSKGTNPIQTAVDQLQGQMNFSFEDALTQNGNMATAIITDYGKVKQVSGLIQSGTLSWNDSQHATAVAKAANEYERKLWVTLLPLYWWPTYSYFDYNSKKDSKCGNTVYMRMGGWAYTSSTWTPYWLTCGGLKWWCGAIEGIAARLQAIGVSMEQVIMGDGDWGPPFAYWRKHPCGQQQQPSCVKSS